MRATKEYIEKKFNEYNVLCFGGQLQPLPIRLSRARTFLGQVAYTRRRKLNGTWHYQNFEFRISTLIDMPENIVEDTILHEMIHYYILSNQLQDTSSHGRLFCTMMNDINKHFGRHITISHRRTEAEKDGDTQKRQHLICVVRFNDGRVGITIAASTRLFDFWDRIPKAVGVAECKWYVSTNPYFNRYSRSIKPKVYGIADEILQEQLRDARRLIRNGDTISVARNS